MKRAILIIMGFLLVGFSAVAQNSVKGTIKDENGQPIPGVNILEKNTTMILLKPIVCTLWL